MKIEIEKLSPSVFLNSNGEPACLLYLHEGSFKGWFTNKLYDYGWVEGWIAGTLLAGEIAAYTYGFPGEFLE